RDGGLVQRAYDDRVALHLEAIHRLRAGIVELGGLADHDGSGGDEQDSAEVSPFGHRRPPAASRRENSAAPIPSPPAASTRRPPSGECPRRAPGPGPPP